MTTDARDLSVRSMRAMATDDLAAPVEFVHPPTLQSRGGGRARHVIRSAVAANDPPLRLVVGQDARGWIGDKLTEELGDLARRQPSTPAADA